MIFESELIPGVLLKRYKRFFVDIKVKGKIIKAHCPNTGSMMGLLEKGNKGYLSGYEKAQLISSDTQELRAGDLLAVNILSAANGVVQVTPLCS